MARGDYGPLDRDRHFVVGWGADQAVGYGVGRALRPISPVLEAQAKMVGGVTQVVRGARAMGTRSTPVSEPSLFTSVAMFLGSIGMVWGFFAIRGSLRDAQRMLTPTE